VWGLQQWFEPWASKSTSEKFACKMLVKLTQVVKKMNVKWNINQKDSWHFSLKAF